MTNPAYEFTPQQNATLAGLARRMRTVGVVLVLVALLVVVQSLLIAVTATGNVVGFAVAAILLLIGLWSVRAGREFSRIVSTEGADVSHLMQGLGEIRKLYDVQFWAFAVLAVLVSLALFAVSVGPGRVNGPYP